MKFRFSLLSLLFVVSLVSCSSPKTVSNEMDKTQTAGSQMEDTQVTSTLGKAPNDDGFKLIDEQTKDIDNDAKNDSIKLYINKDDASNILKVKLSINDDIKAYEIKPPFSFNSAKKMVFINMDKGYKGVLIKFFDTNNEDSFVPENASPYLYDFNCIAVGYLNKKITTLLNLFEYSFNKENNYIVKYLGNFRLQFDDSQTNFSVTYKPYFSEPNKAEYQKGFEQLDDFKIPKAMSQKCFYDIKAEDINSDGIDEIICSKFIPGVYHADVLGVIDYEFKLEADKYHLTKESLWYNKLLDLPLIKEQVITEGKN